MKPGAVEGRETGVQSIVVVGHNHHCFSDQHRDGVWSVEEGSGEDGTLGAQIEVPTLDGVVKIKVPEGTQINKVFRLKGQGIPPCRPAVGAINTCGS